MKKQAFDNELYLKIQKEEIIKRINSFDQKLYLEFGGKLFDDFHASRVLPGFKPDSKVQLLLNFKKDVEIIFVVKCEDIIDNKLRNDTGISYQDEVIRLIDSYHEANLYVSSVVLSFYVDSPVIEEFKTRLANNNIAVYKHYKINGYPHNIPLIYSEDGLGKNEYIKTTRPLVVVTAPGPNSGKMATCLSQLYHENKKGIHAGYAKYETFPVWNLPSKHLLNLAYEAATVDIKDFNVIDPFHFEAYNVIATNYNRDVESFPLLKEIFSRIYGKSPYNSPTDMGVNMVGFAIKDENSVIKACKDEIIRRYFQTIKNRYLGRATDDAVFKSESLMQQAGVSIDDRKCVKKCLEKARKENVPCMAIELHNGKIITGKQTTLFTASAAMLLNAIKVLAKVDDSLPLLSKNVIEPIKSMKQNMLHYHTGRLNIDDVLIALFIQAQTNPLSELVIKEVAKLAGCQAHSSVLLSDKNLQSLNKLQIQVSEEPISYANKLYIK